LQQLHYAGNFVFNKPQCNDILTIEIPALRSKDLSFDAQNFLDGLEYAIKDMYAKNGNVFLYFDGD
jgi:hypothetical protein